MKKFLTITLLMSALALSACTDGSSSVSSDTTSNKAFEEAKLSMESGDYTASLNYLKLAEQEGYNNSDLNEMEIILEKYLKAKEEFDKINMDGAKEALNAIPNSYTKYTIISDIDKLKEDVESKSQIMADIDIQMDAVRKFIASGDYESASANITELYTKDTTNYQRKQIDELKATVETAQEKINEKPKETPTVIYVPQPQENTKVIATYYVINCKEWITLRSAPSTSASSLAHIPLGQAVGYIENTGNGFYKINYDGKVGYGLAAYLSSSKPSDPIPPSNQSASQKNYSTPGHPAQVVNCNEWITLRSIPSTSGDSLAHIPLGAYVTYISTAENGFYCIEYKGQRGYALQSYIALR